MININLVIETLPIKRTKKKFNPVINIINVCGTIVLQVIMDKLSHTIDNPNLVIKMPKIKLKS